MSAQEGLLSEAARTVFCAETRVSLPTLTVCPAGRAPVPVGGVTPGVYLVTVAALLACSPPT